LKTSISSTREALISWGFLGMAAVILGPLALTLVQLAPAASRFGWTRGLFHVLEYVLLPGSWAVLKVVALAVLLGLFVDLVGRLATRILQKPLLPACMITALVYLGLTHFATNPGLNEFLYGRLRAVWLPNNLQAVPVFVALSATAGVLAFVYFDRLWAVSLLRSRRWRSVARPLGAAYGVALVFALLRPMLWPLASPAHAAARNVVLISMDTLRSDHLGVYGYSKPTSPHVDALGERGMVFYNAITQAPWTLPAHMTLFTGLYPSEHGVTRYAANRYAAERRKWQVLSPEIPVLAEVLERNGYVTAAFTGGGFVRPAFGFARGFDVYRTDSRRLEGFHANALRWLRRNLDRRFFLFLHFYNTHRPYEPPAPYDTMFVPAGSEQLLKRVAGFCGRSKRRGAPPSGPLLEAILAQYDGEIRFADELLGRIFLLMDELGLSQNTLIVFLSDHGEAFYEHANCDHLKSLYDTLLRVPLILAGPDIEPGLRIERVVELRDVPQWILDYVGVPVRLGSPTTSLRQLIQGDDPGEPAVAYAETCCKGYEIREGRWVRKLWRTGLRSLQTARFKLIADDGGVPLEFFDLLVDPLERNNLLGSAEALRDEHRAIAYRTLKQALLARRNHTIPPGHDRHLDPETSRQLRALGYAD
jgi:arylsulfatase A-like enzyme